MIFTRDLEHHLARGIRCPHCGAAPGKHCRNRDGMFQLVHCDVRYVDLLTRVDDRDGMRWAQRLSGLLSVLDRGKG